jgi:hypothetical protein
LCVADFLARNPSYIVEFRRQGVAKSVIEQAQKTAADRAAAATPPGDQWNDRAAAATSKGDSSIAARALEKDVVRHGGRCPPIARRNSLRRKKTFGGMAPGGGGGVFGGIFGGSSSGANNPQLEQATTELQNSGTQLTQAGTGLNQAAQAQMQAAAALQRVGSTGGSAGSAGGATLINPLTSDSNATDANNPLATLQWVNTLSTGTFQYPLYVAESPSGAAQTYEAYQSITPGSGVTGSTGLGIPSGSAAQMFEQYQAIGGLPTGAPTAGAGAVPMPSASSIPASGGGQWLQSILEGAGFAGPPLSVRRGVQRLGTQVSA